MNWRVTLHRWKRRFLAPAMVILAAGVGGLAIFGPSEDCAPGAAGDLCRYESFVASLPRDATEAARMIGTIADPVVRVAAVNKWMEANPGASPEEGRAVCALLPDGERQNCERRVNSPHLHR